MCFARTRKKSLRVKNSVGCSPDDIQFYNLYLMDILCDFNIIIEKKENYVGDINTYLFYKESDKIKLALYILKLNNKDTKRIERRLSKIESMGEEKIKKTKDDSFFSSLKNMINMNIFKISNKNDFNPYVTIKGSMVESYTGFLV